MQICLAGQPGHSNGEPEWRIDLRPVDYDTAIHTMEERVEEIAKGAAPELVWLLEHPALYTAGTSADPADLLDARFPVHRTGRGGQYTYHGPGQRVAYVMLDLSQRGRDVRCHVRNLEQWLIDALARFDVAAERREGRVGLWVDMNRYGGAGEAKIAAIGVRIRRWVTYHGIALNVSCDLSHFSGIVPCGIAEHGVTSLAALGIGAAMQDVDAALKASWADVFSRR